MTDTRPILLGMNNPLSRNPEHALYPYPPGCTGHRIFQMLREAHLEVTEDRYLLAFCRRNMVVGREWDKRWARAAAADLWTLARGRTLVMLGQAVAEAMGTKSNGGPKVMTWDEMPTGVGPATRWVILPHPSGRNRWYNQPGNREAAVALLGSLYG